MHFFKHGFYSYTKKNNGSLNHSSIIAKYWVACVLVYYNKCKMKIVSNDFNILKWMFQI
jgi:hypothetical protein